MIRCTQLGTGGMRPIPGRPLSSTFIECNGKGILIDCGEGTQTQFLKYSRKMSKISVILITHDHGDHCYGLPGLLISMSNDGRTEPITIFAPNRARKVIASLVDLVPRSNRNFDVTIFYLPDKDGSSGVLNTGDFKISYMKVKHTVPTLSYKIKEIKNKNIKYNKELCEKYINEGLWDRRGQSLLFRDKVSEITLTNGKTVTKKDFIIDENYQPHEAEIAVIVDTKYFPNLRNFVKGCDLVIAEAMHTGVSETDKMHMTLDQCLDVVKDNDVKNLWTTHYSPSNIGPVVNGEKGPAFNLPSLEGINIEIFNAGRSIEFK